MIPLGYMLKKIVPPPEWMKAPQVELVYSVSSCCTSKDFGDWIDLWKHNGWWFFDNPEILEGAVAELKAEGDGLMLFYYEAFEQEYDEEAKVWSVIAPEPTFSTNVIVPPSKRLEGYDVVTFSVHTSPECSPLSCCSLATAMGANRFCLFDDFERARELVEAGKLNCEPGPFRILGVYTVKTAEEIPVSN